MAKTISAPDKSKYAGVDTAIKNGVKLDDIPFLMLANNGTTASITGHEGRHRAMALKQLGVDLMPIVIKAYTIRWGCQNNPEMKYDYVKEWPTKLVTENGDELPFPFSRDIYFKDAKDRLSVNNISESIKLPSDFITDIEELKEVLAEFKIKNYTINDDLIVDVNGSVSMKDNDFFFKFGVVDGDFIIGRFWRTP